jgi:hypothetical protein
MFSDNEVNKNLKSKRQISKKIISTLNFNCKRPTIFFKKTLVSKKYLTKMVGYLQFFKQIFANKNLMILKFFK